MKEKTQVVLGFISCFSNAAIFLGRASSVSWSQVQVVDVIVFVVEDPQPRGVHPCGLCAVYACLLVLSRFALIIQRNKPVPWLNIPGTFWILPSRCHLTRTSERQGQASVAL